MIIVLLGRSKKKVMDRKIAPKIQAIRKVIFPSVTQHKLKNGIPLHIISSSDHDIIKLELVFKAGRSTEREPLSSKATSSLLKEGTGKYSSEELAEKIDFYGSSISCSSGMDTNSITLFCAKKYFNYSLELVQEILFNPSFPEQELAKYKTRSAERLHQELSKNAVVAYRKITEVIYGKEHCYGYNTFPESYKSVKRENLIHHFQHCYTSDSCQMYLSGCTDHQIIKAIDDTMGHDFGLTSLTPNYILPANVDIQQFRISGNKLQNSIKIGKRLFNRQHPDYYTLFMLNTILGGYFGARLMSSIREEKGYTYNIYSVLESMAYDGYFYISTEVGSEYQDKTVDAIKEEIELLQNELVDVNELDMAKNYVLGNFLSMLDGPLKSSKVLKMLFENGLSTSDFDNMVHVISSVTSEQLLTIAQKHLDFNNLHQVSVGDF